MASIDTNKGYPRLRWRLPNKGGSRSKKCPDTQTAKLWVAEATQAELRGEDWTPPGERRPAGEGMLLIDLATDWLRGLSRTARPRTITTYATKLGYFLDWLPSGSDAAALRDLTIDAVQEYDRHNHDRGLSVAARRARVACIKVVTKWIVVQGHECPDAAKIAAMKMPPQPKGLALALSWAEVDAIVGRIGGRTRILATLQRCTGLRRAEVAALRWADVMDLDSKNPKLWIRDAITKGGRAGRILPMAPALAVYLRHLRDQPGEDTTGLIGQVQAGAYSSGWGRALRAAVEAGEVTEMALHVRSATHLVRKSFASNLRKRKADADAVEHLIGHDLGIKSHYIDLTSLCEEAVAMVPDIPGYPTGGSREIRQKKDAIDGNVIPLPVWQTAG